MALSMTVSSVLLDHSMEEEKNCSRRQRSTHSRTLSMHFASYTESS